MAHSPIFQPYEFGEQEKALLDKDGHILLPGILTPEACERLTASLSHIQDLVPSAVEGHEPNRFAGGVRRLSGEPNSPSTDARLGAKSPW